MQPIPNDHLKHIIRLIRHSLNGFNSIAPKRAPTTWTPTIDGAALNQESRNQHWRITIAHLKWMCDEMEMWDFEEKHDKILKWIGFIQGCLWILTPTTISDLKAVNRLDLVQEEEYS